MKRFEDDTEISLSSGPFVLNDFTQIDLKHLGSTASYICL